MNKNFIFYLPLIFLAVIVGGAGYVLVGPVNPTPTPTVTPTIASNPTATPLPPTDTPTPADTPLPPSSTATEAPTPTNTPTLVPTTPTPTDTPTHAPTNTPNATVTLTPTVSPTLTLTSTFTATPVSLPTATPLPGAIVVSPSDIDLYFGPGTIYQKIGTLGNGETLNVRGRLADNKWIEVNSITSSATGWVQVNGSIQMKIDLNTIPVVEPPIPSTPLPPPVLIAPGNNETRYKNRADLSWDWSGPLGSNDYYRVEIWNYYNDCCEYHRQDDNTFAEKVEPIDVAWTKDKTYLYYKVKEAYKPEYKWRVTVVRYTGTNPLIEKDWAREAPNLQVWEPGLKDQFELVSWPCQLWMLYVEPGDESPPDVRKPTPER